MQNNKNKRLNRYSITNYNIRSRWKRNRILIPKHNLKSPQRTNTIPPHIWDRKWEKESLDEQIYNILTKNPPLERKKKISLKHRSTPNGLRKGLLEMRKLSEEWWWSLIAILMTGFYSCNDLGSRERRKKKKNQKELQKKKKSGDKNVQFLNKGLG